MSSARRLVKFAIMEPRPDLALFARVCPLLGLAAFMLAGGVSGCGKKSASGPAGGFATQVVAVKVNREAITERLRVVGTVLANETVDLKPEVDGRVIAIHFEEGQRVEEGQLLVELDSGTIEAMLAEAEAIQRLAESKWKRAHDLLTNKTMSQQEADEARAQFDMTGAKVTQMREQLRYMKIRAPFSAIVGARKISPGQVITKQTVMTTLNDIDPVKVEGNVPERFLSLAKVGARFQISLAAFPSEKFEGELYFVAPQLDPVNRTALVKAKIPNADLRIKPGMFASADMTLRVREEAIVIPEAALMPQGERFAVIVVDGEMTAQMRPVQPGVRNAGRVEIVDGLKEGETVVVEGWQKTRPGGKVKLAPAEKAAPYSTAAK
jgi:membrane fusion protein (multidrug efflux system)